MYPLHIQMSFYVYAVILSHSDTILEFIIFAHILDYQGELPTWEICLDPSLLYLLATDRMYLGSRDDRSILRGRAC